VSYSHAEAWIKMLEQVIAEGEETQPRGMLTQELRWSQHRVLDSLTFPLRVNGREFRDVIGVIEGLSLAGEFSVPEVMLQHVKGFEQFEDNGIMWGAYGQRAFGSVGNVVDLLRKDPDSRQAVVTLFDSKQDLAREKKDIPCTISLQFLLRDGRLELGVSMRSNDLWLGTPYDMVQFSILQASVAQALGVIPGDYVHRAGSLHLYERDVQKAMDVSFKGEPAMPFPLWSAIDGDEWKHIGRRARRLVLGWYDFEPATPFEEWAWKLVHGA
jgi:thymidylate synthase